MDDSSRSNGRPTGHETAGRIPLGMSSFGAEEREQFGQNVRLAMACMEGTEAPASTRAMPTDEAAIRSRLKVLSQDITSGHADLLELLVRYDDIQGWSGSGCKHCAAWMNLEMGISLQLAWEYLRVGRKLRLLSTTRALFRAGKLSWSKIRLIASVADKDNEKTLCHAALDASVTDVHRLCSEYRWNREDRDGDENGGEDGNKDNGENVRALQQWLSRSLHWGGLSNGNTRIQLILPPELAQAFLASVEHSLHQLENADGAEITVSQRRADAALLMAETSLQAAGRDTATADRYQVIVSVDASELAVSGRSSSESMASGTAPAADESDTPSRRATVNGAGPVARETARRIACDCSITTHITSNGEPIDIGRKSRLWPNAMARAIKERDQHCQFCGCTQTRNLQIHHIVHWADGGSTSVANGVCLCQGHHTKVHEGGYTLQHVDSHEQRLEEQFEQQRLTEDLSMFDFEKELRNDRESFNQVRRLLPTRYRFRTVDADGNDIRHQSSDMTFKGEVPASSTDAPSPDTHSTAVHSSTAHSTAAHSTAAYSTVAHSTRVECGGSVSGRYGDVSSGGGSGAVGENDSGIGSGGEDDHDQANQVAERPAVYRHLHRHGSCEHQVVSPHSSSRSRARVRA